jgi:hypothetical protein
VRQRRGAVPEVIEEKERKENKKEDKFTYK